MLKLKKKEIARKRRRRLILIGILVLFSLTIFTMAAKAVIKEEEPRRVSYRPQVVANFNWDFNKSHDKFNFIRRKYVTIYDESKDPFRNTYSVKEYTQEEGLFLLPGRDDTSIGSRAMHEGLMAYYPYVKEASLTYGVPMDWIFAIILEESGASNPETPYAIGPMQIEKSVWLGIYDYQELANPKANILIGTKLLSSYGCDSIYESLGCYGRGVSGWNSMKAKCGIVGREVSSYEEAARVLEAAGDINFIRKMENWHQKFEDTYFY